MAVLQSAAMDSIDRLTPYNIASTVWALGKLLLRTPSSVASRGCSIRAAQQASGNPAAGSASSTVTVSGQGDSVEGRLFDSDPCPGLRRPSYPAAGAGYESSDSDAGGAFSSGEELMEGWGSGGSRQPAMPSRQGSAAIGTAGQTADTEWWLLDGLAAATARCARQFKPAHVGDALWGFGCLGLSPGDAAVSDLLSAAAATREPGLRPAHAACALIGLAELATLGASSTAGSCNAQWLTEHRQTLGFLAGRAGAGFASLRPTSAEEVCFVG